MEKVLPYRVCDDPVKEQMADSIMYLVGLNAEMHKNALSNYEAEVYIKGHSEILVTRSCAMFPSYFRLTTKTKQKRFLNCSPIPGLFLPTIFITSLML